MHVFVVVAATEKGAAGVTGTARRRARTALALGLELGGGKGIGLVGGGAGGKTAGMGVVGRRVGEPVHAAHRVGVAEAAEVAEVDLAGGVARTDLTGDGRTGKVNGTLAEGGVVSVERPDGGEQLGVDVDLRLGGRAVDGGIAVGAGEDGAALSQRAERIGSREGAGDGRLGYCRGQGARGAARVAEPQCAPLCGAARHVAERGR